MILPSTRTTGFAGRPILATILLLAFLSVAAIPIVRQDIRDQERKEIIETLATITMAKTAYAVDNELIDGRAVTLEQIIKPKTASDPKEDRRWGKYLQARPTFPLKGELKLHPIGELPSYVLENGEEIKIDVGSRNSSPQSTPE